MEKIGLIAGNRKFPLLFAQAAKDKGYSVVVIAVKKDTSPAIKKIADEVHWISLGDFSKLVDIFKKDGINKVVMAGQISPHRLFSKEVANNPEIQNILKSIKDKKADTIFSAIAQKLEEHGLELLPSTMFMEEYLPKAGTLTKKELTQEGREELNFGRAIAKEIAYLDIGQTVAVKHKAVVAVEALEGTDNLIRRAGRVAGRGVTIVKVSKPKQDLRFDIPVVGLNTIKNLIKIGARCLGIEADKTIFIDQEASIKLADKKGLTITAV